jgi:phage gp36-like protein
MAYSDSNDIQALIKWVTFSNTSKVTLTELQQYISDADTIIDSKLERIYQVPITNADDINILKYISARLAAVEIAQVLVLHANGQIPPTIIKWQDAAYDRLEKILDGTIDLPNSTKLTSNKGLYSYTADENNDCEAIWSMKDDNW